MSVWTCAFSNVHDPKLGAPRSRVEPIRARVSADDTHPRVSADHRPATGPPAVVSREASTMSLADVSYGTCLPSRWGGGVPGARAETRRHRFGRRARLAGRGISEPEGSSTCHGVPH